MKPPYLSIFLILFLLAFTLKGSGIVNPKLRGDTFSDSLALRLLISKRGTLKPMGNLYTGDVILYWLPESFEPIKGEIEDLRPDSIRIDSEWLRLSWIESISPHPDLRKKRRKSVLRNVGASLLFGTVGFFTSWFVLVFLGIVFAFGGYNPFEGEEISINLKVGLIVALFTFLIYSLSHRKLKFRRKKYLFQILPK